VGCRGGSGLSGGLVLVGAGVGDSKITCAFASDDKMTLTKSIKIKETEKTACELNALFLRIS
jgi:hypothetical protein